jgi:2-polyprenyl-3-methyl-5-hydroxy-6-metoxy-1,4-benzoquinol methylase
MAPVAEQVVTLTGTEAATPLRVLDIAASHGIFGLAFARRNPNARVTGLDWANVLQVAKENAQCFGVADRYDTIPGSAFDVDWGGARGTTYDLVLLPNFLHHFDAVACEKLLKKARAALAPGGRVVTVEFIPNEDRVSPPMAATFALVMLAHTPGGDAYTFAELDRMCRNAGLTHNELHEIASPGRVVISRP